MYFSLFIQKKHLSLQMLIAKKENQIVLGTNLININYG